MKAVVALLLLANPALWAYPGARELKQQIVGTWVLDEDASLDRCKRELKAKGADRATIKAAQKRLRAFIRETAISYRFGDDQLQVDRGGQVQDHVLRLKRAAGKMLVFESNQVLPETKRPLQISVFFVDRDHMSLEVNGSSELEHCVWQRKRG